MNIGDRSYKITLSYDKNVKDQDLKNSIDKIKTVLTSTDIQNIAGYNIRKKGDEPQFLESGGKNWKQLSDLDRDSNCFESLQKVSILVLRAKFIPSVESKAEFTRVRLKEVVIEGTDSGFVCKNLQDKYHAITAAQKKKLESVLDRLFEEGFCDEEEVGAERLFDKYEFEIEGDEIYFIIQGKRVRSDDYIEKNKPEKPNE